MNGLGVLLGAHRTLTVRKAQNALDPAMPLTPRDHFSAKELDQE